MPHIRGILETQLKKLAISESHISLEENNHGTRILLFSNMEFLALIAPWLKAEDEKSE